MRFTGIFRACNEIAGDNNMWRHLTAEQIVQTYEAWLNTLDHTYNLLVIDQWLKDLPTAELETLCAGDQEDWPPILAKAPDGESVHALLDDFFMAMGG